MPALQRAYERSEGDLVVLAVNFREPQGQASGFVRELELTFPVVLDSKGEVASAYGVRGFPSSFFLDAEGVVRALHFGPMDEETIQEQLREAGMP
jgi:peroxiredoxin